VRRGPPPEVEEALLRLIEEREIRGQGELLEGLRELGVRISQPTLSRHLRRLNVIKRRGRYVVGAANPFRAPPCAVRESPPNLLVLKTLPGRAQLLAILIDQSHPPGIAGTMAGDDTVFVAVDAGVSPADARAALAGLLETGEAR